MISKKLDQIKKMCVFRVTQPYLNLLLKPRIFRYLEKYIIILCILKGISPFKMHKILFFSRKKRIKKICVPTLPKIFSPVTLITLIFLFGLTENSAIKGVRALRGYFGPPICRVGIKPGFYPKAQPGGLYGFYEGGFWGFY